MDRVVCFGEALIDFSPAPARQGSARAFVQHAGGAPANVAVAIARLGGQAEFAGMLGSDAFGDFLLRSLQDAGVGVRFVRRTDQAPTALAFVTLDAQGERSFSFYRPPAADLLFRADDLPDDAFAGGAILHVCSNSMTEETIAHTTFVLMRRARDAGALVSYDMNLRPALWPRGADPRPRLWRAALLADVIKLSREEFEVLAADAGDEARACARLWQAACRLLLVTDGARPLRWMTPERTGVLPSFAVTAIDATAAGDAFAGGLLFGLATRRIARCDLPALAADEPRLRELLRFAAACGAWAATRPGAFAAMPRRAEAEVLMQSVPISAGSA
jgi:fructokinase